MVWCVSIPMADKYITYIFLCMKSNNNICLFFSESSEGEESRRFVKAVIRSFIQKETTLPSVLPAYPQSLTAWSVRRGPRCRTPSSLPPRPLGFLPNGVAGTGRLLSRWEWHGRGHRPGAAPQEVRLLGYKLSHVASGYEALQPSDGPQAGAKAPVQREVSSTLSWTYITTPTHSWGALLSRNSVWLKTKTKNREKKTALSQQADKEKHEQRIIRVQVRNIRKLLRKTARQETGKTSINLTNTFCKSILLRLDLRFFLNLKVRKKRTATFHKFSSGAISRLHVGQMQTTDLILRPWRVFL